MKPGSRALGIAESYADDSSTLAGAVVTADGRPDAFVIGRCTVGGTDLTDSIIDLFERLDREDVRLLFVAGVALAWFNILDLDAVAASTDRPVIAVTFEESGGLESAIREAFEGADRADRLERYRALPPRQPVDLDDRRLYVRSAGCPTDRARALVETYTLEEAARPEPLRVAKLTARAVDEWRTGEGR